MSNTYHKKQSILFTIDIKVSGQTLSIPVYDGDNHQELVKRFSQQHIFKSDYQQAIKDKIIQALLATLRKAQISATLKKKVNTFLAVNQSILQSKSKQKSQKSFKANSNSSTPFKMLPQYSNPSHSHRINSGNRHVSVHAENKGQKQKSLKQVEIKPYEKPKCIRKNKTQSNKPPIPAANPSKSRSSVSALQDKDLISAYETILKKSKQPEMKMMAKKYLQEHGFMKSQKKTHLLNKKLQSNKKDEINNQKITNPITQQGNNTNSYIHSLTKFSIVQPSHLIPTPQNRSNTPSKNKNNGNNHRIKYDIDGKSVEIGKFDIGADYSRYQHQLQQVNLQSYRAPRASVSYQRLPYNYLQQQNYEDNKSFRNSRISPSYQPQRAISLRRTRKYKYL